MAESGDIIVLDIGKTLSKLSRWSAAGVLRNKATRPNARSEVDGIAVLDVEGIGTWVAESLKEFGKQGPVSAVIPVAHGAGVAAIRDGQLAFPPLDYEQNIPTDVLAAYRTQRDGFADTGSPALPMGLNIGSQLHWLDAKLDGAVLLPWAQYWSWFLSGIATSEVTSLGCHSDLWGPTAGKFSAMAERRGWAARFAPIAKAGDVIGTLKSEFGLGNEVRVHCGVHDSNAALVAARGFSQIEDCEATVLSTGTWFIAMRFPNETLDLTALPEARDCLVNVDTFGQAVPSARFMGGREADVLGVQIDQAGLHGLADAIASSAMLLPSFVPGSGPFPDATGAWINEPNDPTQRAAAVALYLALMADVVLDLIGAKDRLLIEGRFAKSEILTRALATLRPNIAVYAASNEADVSLGALRLVDPSIRPPSTLERIAPLSEDLDNYRETWHNRGGRT